MVSWLEIPTLPTHKVHETAEALEAVLAKYGVSSPFLRTYIFPSFSLIKLDAGPAGSLGHIGESTA
jgi:hypothetical protein